MSKPKVYVTRQIPDEGMKLLYEKFDVYVNPHDRVVTREELLRDVKGKDALLCLLTETIDAEVFEANPNLKIVANYAVGYNNIDVAEATKRGIPVSNTPGVLTDTTADFAWALLMAAARRVVEGDKFTREGRFVGWAPMLLLGHDVHHKTIGIVGFGRIGQAVAKRAMGFEMKILYYDVNQMPEVARQYNAEYRELDDLLRESDFVTLHVDLNEHTHHLIDERALGLMKPNAYLINTARGPVVDEAALVKALRENRIAGAGLDVFEDEPALAPGLAELDNVVIAPHIASATKETRGAMARIAAENVIAALEGRKPPTIVNPEVWKD
ncbi:MAG: D-glycerate dehydrogenase [Firmicutes bacterium]|jgi:glyoxylate reductase|nr:D-glycerate dehydrogenase [Bacillota bacterium]